MALDKFVNQFVPFLTAHMDFLWAIVGLAVEDFLVLVNCGCLAHGQIFNDNSKTCKRDSKQYRKYRKDSILTLCYP